MPRGERQTTGTAQALLGAKQIAAQERASKRATVADYVKTGVGALKGVGDYLQKKQALEQNQEKLNLETSLFSAQYGGPAEQEATRERKRQLELANIGLAGAQTRVAQGTVESDIAAKKALAAKAGSEAKISEVTARFAEQFAGGKLELAKAQKDKILQDIEASKAGITDAAERTRIDGQRLQVEKTYREALMDDMKEKGLLSKRQMKIFEKRYKDETDPARRVAMMTEWEKRAAESGARKGEIDVEFAEGTLENRIADIALDLKGKREDVKRKGFENDTAKIVAHYARLRETSSIDNVIAHTDLIDQQMKTLISKAKDDKERLALEGRRVKIAEVHGRAVLDKMERDGTLAEKEFNLLEDKWETTKDPKKREAMLSPYDKKLREAQLKEVEARPGQLKSAQELQELQKGPLREAAAKSIKRQRKGLTEAETESINAAKVVVTNTMEEHPHLRDLGVGANEELGELNREGPNFRLLSSLTNLHRDGIVTLDELRPHSLTSGTKEGGGWAAGAGTKGDAAFKNLGNTWHHLGVGDRPALVKHLAKTWKKGPAALDEAAKHIEDNWSSIVAAHMKGSPMQNLGFLLGTRETNPAAEANIKRSFFKGLADAMRSVSEGVEPESFYRFEIRGNILSEIGLKDPVERARINVPQ